MTEKPDHRDRDIAQPTIVSLLRTRAEQQPGRVSYEFVSESGDKEIVTYADLDRRARGIAGQLSDLRLGGERAMLLYPPGLDYIAAFYGCLYAGVIAVPGVPAGPGAA